VGDDDVSTETPAPGTTRYLCPLECGWHHDVPPPSIDRIAELGAIADPAARDIHEAISSVAHRATFAEAQRTEAALRDHLATHTTEQFVRAIQGLRAEVAGLAAGVRPDEDSKMIRRRSLPESLRWLADKLDSGTLSPAELAGVAVALRVLADTIT
jgi:hypothetical protein